MNLESYTINIWCMIGENSEFSVDSEIETERDKLDRRYLMAPSAMVYWYIRHSAVQKNGDECVCWKKNTTYARMRLDLSLFQYSSSIEQIRCTPTFSENDINIDAMKCQICHNGPSTKHAQLSDISQCLDSALSE